jgi:predicted ABC-type ATPase
MDTPSLRMFAGPNGPRKSTIKSVVPPELLGLYLDALNACQAQARYVVKTSP